MNQKIRQPLEAIFPINEKIKRIIDAIIIIWIVSDIIILTSLYFIDISPNTRDIIVIFDTALCIVLFIEFVLKIQSEGNKKQYIKEDWDGIIVDIVAMIPYELLVPGSFGYIRLLRLLRIFGLFGKSKKNIFNFIQKTKLNYVFFTLLIIICAGSIAIWVLESAPDDKINAPIDAVWYVMATISTVGYGDVTPESFGGKLLGIILMILGIGFFSLLTAILSSWFMKEHETDEDKLENKLTTMEKSIRELKTEIKELKDLLKENK
jgi:voltage-gated potassium channel